MVSAVRLPRKIVEAPAAVRRGPSMLRGLKWIVSKMLLVLDGLLGVKRVQMVGFGTGGFGSLAPICI